MRHERADIISQFWKAFLPRVIVESHSALGGPTKFELKYEPSLRDSDRDRIAGKLQRRRFESNKWPLYPSEIILLSVVASLSVVGVCMGLFALDLLSRSLSMFSQYYWTNTDKAILANLSSEHAPVNQVSVL